MDEFEKKIVLFFRKPHSKMLDIFSHLISSVYLLLFFWFSVVVSVMFFDFINGLYLVLGLAIVFILHFIISEGIFKWGGRRFSFERLRPYKAHPELIQPIGKKFHDSSLPSSHLASMVGGMMVLVSFYKFLWLFAIIVAALLSWSRIRNGMHYPSDVLVGIALGFMYGYLALLILATL